MGNLRNLLLVLVNLPFALVGGVLAALLTGWNFSLGSPVGFVTLFGTRLRNSIMLFRITSILVHVDGTTWNLETAIRGASERLAPILMTALVTAPACYRLPSEAATQAAKSRDPWQWWF